ncbi:MAG TPA: hypothetical protein VFC46_12510, partial [Humisphaera sp.]|nr:hypothetical protein [Humisphaera sp.]
MKRRLALFVSTISLGLCLLTTALWVRTFTVTDDWWATRTVAIKGADNLYLEVEPAGWKPWRGRIDITIGKFRFRDDDPIFAKQTIGKPFSPIRWRFSHQHYEWPDPNGDRDTLWQKFGFGLVHEIHPHNFWCTFGVPFW